MNVVVLGAGTVGRAIAEILCGRGLNVCVVDLQADVLRRVEEQLDVRTVCGSATDATTLFQAGALSADLCLAVTSLDEVNLISSSVAGRMGARRCVARVLNPALRDRSTFDYQHHFGIDRLISLEYQTAIEVARHIHASSALAVQNFVRGRIEVQALTVGARSKAVGVRLRDLELPPDVKVGLIAGSREAIVPGADDFASAGDQVTLIGGLGRVQAVSGLFQEKAASIRRVIIAGGGDVGLNLASLLENTRCRVTIMESDQERCEYLAERLPKATVLLADVKSKADLEEARVGTADVFVACTGHDEENIVCGVEAKQLGCDKLITIVRSPDYANVLERLGIDVAVSPREAMARQVLGFVADGPVRERCEIVPGVAEVWEIGVRGGMPATEAPLQELGLLRSVVVAIEHDGFVKVPGATDRLAAGDTALVLVHQSARPQVMQLFSI